MTEDSITQDPEDEQERGMPQKIGMDMTGSWSQPLPTVDKTETLTEGYIAYISPDKYISIGTYMVWKLSERNNNSWKFKIVCEGQKPSFICNWPGGLSSLRARRRG